MNYLVKYMIKGEYNIVSVTETSMNKVDVDMNSLVMAMIKCKTNLLANFVVHVGYTLAAFWIIFVYIVATFGIILSTFGNILATFWLHSGYFLDTFWIHFGYILGYIIATFWLHSCYIWLLFG